MITTHTLTPDTDTLTPDTEAVLLLCGRFGKSQQTETVPLKPSEYDRLAIWLRQENMRPGDLLHFDAKHRLETATLPIPLPRLLALLGRGVALALAVESWSNKGLWVISRSDVAYPPRLKSARSSPPILYGVGEKTLLAGGGLAVVGSRDADESALNYTRRVSGTCAHQGIQVVSGGARGVDSEALVACIAEGGNAVGILADSLARSALSGKYRDSLEHGKLALASPYDPGSGFDKGNAMGRNKYVYAMADYALVVSSAFNRGGTWAGAVEALRHEKTPVFVRQTGEVPKGNHELLDRGAKPFPREPWDDLQAKLRNSQKSVTERQGSFSVDSSSSVIRSPEDEHSPTDAASQAETQGVGDISTSKQEQPKTAYEAVLPLILSHLTNPRDAKWLANELDIQIGQMKVWLKVAVEQGRVAKKRNSKLYIVSPEHGTLFPTEALGPERAFSREQPSH